MVKPEAIKLVLQTNDCGMLRTTLLRNFIHDKINLKGKKMRCTLESLFRRYYLILQPEKALNTGAGFHCLSLSKGFNGK